MMGLLSAEWAVYLCEQPVDFRKGAASLAVWVEAQWLLNPFSEAFFVFRNRQRTAIKILYWERNGFCLWQKRLEKERFTWPKPGHSGTVTLSVQQLNWLLAGYDINLMKPHQRLNFQSVL
jgi:transposase